MDDTKFSRPCCDVVRLAMGLGLESGDEERRLPSGLATGFGASCLRDQRDIASTPFGWAWRAATRTRGRVTA
jgi:hypothetical protein